ncbi:MAG: hypothetical protein U9Q98_02965, partial [Bacteroidota bacterium]|nr:hypothetical protein [Bacteroidota bacterium]
NEIVMKNIKYILTPFVILILSLLNYGFSQVLTVKDPITIKASVGMYVKGALTGVNGTTGEITNNGTLNLRGDWTNNVSSSFLTGTGEVVFNSIAASQTIGGSSTTSFYDLPLITAVVMCCWHRIFLLIIPLA